MRMSTKGIRFALAASLIAFVVACADTETDAADAAGENTILPENPTGGAGDLGTGTGTTAPGSDEAVPIDSADTAGAPQP